MCPARANTHPPAHDARPVGRRLHHPEVWRLSEALLAARQRLPYASPEARLLDGLQRWVQLEGGAPDPAARLQPTTPRWDGVLALVLATARLVSEPSRRMLAPWLPGGLVPEGLPYAPAPGVSPHAADAARFLARLGTEGANS